MVRRLCAGLGTTMLFAAACSSPNPESDAGDLEDAATDGTPGDVIEAPAPPSPPIFTPCPSGWREHEVAGITTCEPEPRDLDACPPGRARFLGARECVVIGDACPKGDFPDDAPTDALFVRRGASGAGTRVDPFATIDEAVRAAPAGATIVLARGTYEESIMVGRAVHLLGACAERTRIVGDGSASITLETRGRGVIVENVTIRGGEPVTFYATAGEATLAGVIVEGREGIRVGASHASLSLDHVVVHGEGATFIGVGALDTATITARSLNVDGVAGVAVSMEEQSTLEASDVHVVGPVAGSNGVALQVKDAAQATLERGFVEHTVAVGVIVSGDGAFLDASDVVFRDLQVDAEFVPSGSAVGVQYDGRATLRRIWCDRAADAAIVLPGVAGGATLDLSDVAITDTQRGATNFARVVSFGDASNVTFARLRGVGGASSAFYVSGEGTNVRGSDLWIGDIETGPTPGTGTLQVQERASLDVERVHLENVATTGVLAIEDATVDVRDLTVAGARPDAERGFGRAMSVQQSRATVRRARFVRTPDLGLFIAGANAAAEVSDLFIDEMGECEGCATPSYGFGVAITDGALSIDRFSVGGSAVCGLFIAGGPEVMFSAGLVRDSSIAVCLQTDAPFDLGGGITFDGNDQDLSATSLPVPSLGLPEGDL